MVERIPGVIVTFFPDANFPARMATMAAQVAPLLIADNTTDPATRERVSRIAAAQGAEYLPQPGNGGISSGLNAAFAVLRTRGFSAAIAFDQDSTPAPGCVAALEACAVRDGERAVVGSNWHDEARPDQSSRHLVPHPWLPFAFRRIRAENEDFPSVAFVIASGSWFDLATWHALGGFDESLFLDLVDVDYCLRVHRFHRTVAVAASAQLAHKRGDKRPVRFLGRTWWPAFMPPSRLTGLTANRARLLWRHGRRYPHWATYEVAHAAKVLWDILLLENRKLTKLGAIARGIRMIFTR